MSTLILTLGGPLQSWGAESKFNHHRTNMEPTKSGVVGMIASALGRSRIDSIEDLAGLRFGVRSVSEQTPIDDFHTKNIVKHPILPIDIICRMLSLP